MSYLLIGFWYTRRRAIFANLKAFLVNRVGDFGFLLGIGRHRRTTPARSTTREVFAAAPSDRRRLHASPGTDWQC